MPSDDTESWYPVPGSWTGASPGRSPRPGDAPPLAPSGEWNWWGAARDVRERRVRFDPSNIRHVIVGFVVAFGLALVLYGSIAEPILLHYDLLTPVEPAGEAAAEDADTESAVRAGLLQSALLLIGLPLLWSMTFYRGGWSGARDRLRLRSPDPPADVMVGILGGFGALVVSFIVLLVVNHFFPLPRNEVVEELGGALGWSTIVLIALVSSTTEEVFFRGWLQPRLGIVPTNVLFGFAHLSYGIPMQVVLPMGLGFLFSALTVRHRSLVPATLAHFVFNLVQLSLAKWAVESGALNALLGA